MQEWGHQLAATAAIITALLARMRTTAATAISYNMPWFTWQLQKLQEDCTWYLWVTKSTTSLVQVNSGQCTILLSHRERSKNGRLGTLPIWQHWREVWLKQHNSFLLSLQLLHKSGSHYDSFTTTTTHQKLSSNPRKPPTPHHLWISQCLLSNPSAANTHMD